MAAKQKTSSKKKTKPKKSPKEGTLIIIGGREDKTDSMAILKEVASQNANGKMVIATMASEVPHECWIDYERIFKSLNVKEIEHLALEQHQQALDPKNLELLSGAKTVFFSGGDQLKITTKIGGTPILDAILDIYKGGGIIAGTSAGAAAMGKMMLVGSENEEESHKVGNWMMASGLGLMEDILIDQHFAQRGRIGRLLGAVAMNPGVLGVGIDEDTAIIVKDNFFRVIGQSAVYVIDGSNISRTNISHSAADKAMAMHNVRLHILAQNHRFSMKDRLPYLA